MQKLFEIHPKRPISGILPNRERINNTTVLPLSRAEFLRCMQNGTLYAVLGNKKVLVTETDWDKALALFGTQDDQTIQYKEPTVISKDIATTKDNDAVTMIDVKIINQKDSEKDFSEIINDEIEVIEEEHDEEIKELAEEIDIKPDDENESVEEHAVEIAENQSIQSNPVPKNDPNRNFVPGKNNKNKNNKNNQKR